MEKLSTIQITLLLCVIIYLTIVFYFFKIKRKPDIIKQTTIENKANVNIFSPEENKIQKLTVNLIYDEKESLDVSKYCDLVLSVKDLINNNYSSLSNNMFEEKIELRKEQEKIITPKEKKEDIPLNKILNINSITN